MLAKFHKLAVQTAFNAMPSNFQEKFLTGFSFDLLLESSSIPNEITTYGEDVELHRDHCLKLYLKGRDLHKIGDSTVLEELQALAVGAQEAFKRGDSLVTRYNIARGTHFIVDLGTYPHVNEVIWDKFHMPFEEQAADWIERHTRLVSELVANYAPTPMRSIPNRCRKIADDAYYTSTNFLPCFKRHGQITDLQWAEMATQQCYNLMNWFSSFNAIL